MLCSQQLKPLHTAGSRRAAALACKSLVSLAVPARRARGHQAVAAVAGGHDNSPEACSSTSLSTCQPGVSQQRSTQWLAHAQQVLPKAAALAAVVTLGALLAPHAASAAAAAAAEEGSLLKSKL